MRNFAITPDASAGVFSGCQGSVIQLALAFLTVAFLEPTRPPCARLTRAPAWAAPQIRRRLAGSNLLKPGFDGLRLST
jgi:hypothetical protein